MLETALLVTIVIEILLSTTILWNRRLIVTVLLTLFIPFFTTMLLLESLHVTTVIIAVLSLLRVFNLLRIAESRMHVQYLKNAVTRTSLWLGSMQLVTIGVLVLANHYSVNTVILLYLIAGVQIVAALGLLCTTLYNSYKTRYRQGTTFYADTELPSVSVLIPARNETYDLQQCLLSVLASDYPKLEVIVLDDCSHTKTSEIIKGFAHKGVRFIKGAEVDERWLAKNQAYNRLTAEATGEILLFCGVDVRFGPSAIKAILTEMQTRNKTMVSILPQRLSGSFAGAFIQPMRYWWELALPRKAFNRPPVLSTCWVVRKSFIQKTGGFAAHSRTILPELLLAKRLISENRYSFIRANHILDIQTAKSYKEQRATALRMRYPQIKKRPENVFLLLFMEVSILLSPFIIAVVGYITGNEIILIMSLISAALLILTHVTIVRLTSPANTLIAVITFPVEVMTEIVLVLRSMWQYELGEVLWKDRNICIPVMHVYPKLPEITNDPS